MKGVKFCLTYDQSRIFKFGYAFNREQFMMKTFSGFTQRNAREMMYAIWITRQLIWCCHDHIFKNNILYNISNIHLIRITTADGNELSINEYFRQHKGIRLSNPNLPLIRPEVNNNAVFRNTVFPMQCCKILPFQRIKVEKMSEVLSRELLKVLTFSLLNLAILRHL